MNNTQVATREKPVIIIGTGHVARQVAEVLHRLDTVIYGFLSMPDAGDLPETYNEVPILGSVAHKSYRKMLANEKMDYFIAIEDTALRVATANELFKLTERLPVAIISPTARIAGDADIAQGVFIADYAVVEAGCAIDAGVFIGSGTSVGNDVAIGDAALIGANATIGNGVEMEDQVRLGHNVVLFDGIELGRAVNVAPGAVVLQSVDAQQQVFGNPAQVAT